MNVHERLEWESPFFRWPIGTVFYVEGEWVQHVKTGFYTSAREGVCVSWAPAWVYEVEALQPWDRAGESWSLKVNR